MKVLIIDANGEMLDFAWRASMDNHDVRWFIKDDPHVKEVGRGMAPIVRDFHPHVKWADIIILAENTKYLREADAWRKEGRLVLGATQESASWELNREIGQKVFEAHGIPVVPYKIFNDYDEAIRYVKKENRRFVSKPCGDEPNKALSYVSKSPADMVCMLERWKAIGKLRNPFMLQDFIPGIEMAVAGWFGPGGFNIGWEENFEFKKLMHGDMGPNTGEQGTVLRYVRKSKLADEVLAPLEDALAATGHTGDIDVNCIIAEDGTPYPLEFTCRFGYPAVCIQQALITGDRVELLYDLATGNDSRSIMLDTVAIGVVLAMPDYPYSRLTGKEVCGLPLYGVTDKNADNIHPCQMQLGKAPHNVDDKIVDQPCLTTAGDYICVVTGTGDTVQEAKKECYGVLDKLEMPNSPFWRKDIGDRLKKQLPELQAMGFAAGMEF